MDERSTGTAGGRSVRTGTVVVLLALAVAAGCAMGLLLRGAGGGPTATSTPAVASTGTAPSAVSVTSTTTSAPPTAPALVPVRLTDPVRAALVQAYDAAHGYPPGWVTGTEPGSVYYVLDPGTGEHLAWAGFTVAASAPERVHVTMQDDGARTAFRQPPGGAWQVDDICSMPRLLALVGALPAGGHC